MQQTNRALLWLRNDLRIDDNPALNQALAAGCCKAIFIATPTQWKQHDWAPIKVDLINRHVHLVKNQLASLGIELDVVPSSDFKQQVSELKQYCETNQIEQVFANRELEINENLRDQHAIELGIVLHLFEADVIVNKGLIKNGQGEMFKVFTPFKKAWLKHVKQFGYQVAPTPSATAPTAIKPVESSDHDIKFDYSERDSSKWPTADIVLDQVLPTFYNSKINQYKDNRDFPGIKGTSGLSPYLAIGAISPKTVLNALLARFPDILDNIESQAFCWLNEIIWREFYRHLMFHYPKLHKHKNFNEKYDGLNWPNNHEAFQAWCEGKTGYPIIDAAMQQLVQTGWMHNRLRMIVASFLTKHLLVDWRLGERFFMQHLIDGDLAANNGGWQWSASTGCDAQPYFRIFNPVSQSKKFDPQGRFIRKYLPQLKNLSDKAIHLPPAEITHSVGYYPPIVDLAEGRQQALSFYKV